MSEWKEFKLGELIDERRADLQTGPFGTMLNASEYTATGIPVIAVQDIGENKLNHNKFVYINDNTANRLSRYKVLEGDIIFGRKGAVERRAIIKRNESGWLQGSDCIRLRFDNSINSNFISYQFGRESYKEWMIQNSTGATMPSLNQQVLKLLPITLPPLPEQKAIASVLSSLDDKIDLLHRQNKTLESIAETLFRQWFIEEAQEDWETGELKKYVYIGIGRTPPRKEHQWFSKKPSNVKWISIKDLGNEGVYALDTAEYLTQDAVDQFNIPVIPENTVVLSFKMTVGRVAITTEPMLSNEAIAHFRFRPETPFSVEYLYLFLKSFQYDLLGSTSSIVTAINSAMIKDMEIAIPDENSMERFDNVVKKSFKKIRSNQNQIRTLEKLRDTLLPKLMSGEVRVAV